MTLFTRKHLIASQDIFAGHIFSVRVDTVRSDAIEMVREVVEHNGGVVIACQPTEGEVLLIKQYRYAVDEELLELPAGRLNKGENRLEAAKRELIEETGWRAATWEELPAMYSAPGFCDELLTTYRATDLTWVGESPDEDEHIDVMKLTLEQAWQLVLDGKVRDAKTIAVLGVICR